MARVAGRQAQADLLNTRRFRSSSTHPMAPSTFPKACQDVVSVEHQVSTLCPFSPTKATLDTMNMAAFKYTCVMQTTPSVPRLSLISSMCPQSCILPLSPTTTNFVPLPRARRVLSPTSRSLLLHVGITTLPAKSRKGEVHFD